MTTKIAELKLDIEDLRKLLQQAQRQKAKDLLSIEIRKLETEVMKDTEQNSTSMPKPTAVVAATAAKCYEVKLNNHAWGQTDKFVKIYVTLKNAQSVLQESIVCKFDERAMHLRVLNLDNRNYELLINNLCEEIDPEKSSYKTKTDMIVVSLAKKVPTKWSHMTEVEKRIQEAKMGKMAMDKDGDPGSNLMSMMKKMYEEGDDEMKKTIAKAWTESQDKKVSNKDL